MKVWPVAVQLLWGLGLQLKYEHSWNFAEINTKCGKNKSV